MHKIISIAFALTLLVAPLSAFAQTADSCLTVTGANFNTCCTNAQSDQEVAACRTYYANPGGNGSTSATSGTVKKPGVINTIGTNYQPQVSLDYASSGSGFGGLSFKGVGSALVACTGLGDAVAGLVTNVLNRVKGAILGAVTNIPIVGKIFGGLFGGDKGTQANPSYVKDEALENKAGCLDGIAYVLSQQVLQQITNRTLHWVNTGFGGNPLYIKNIDSYLHSIRDQKLGGFLNSVPGDNPIFGNALRSVVTQQVTGLSDGLLNKTLNTPQAKEYNSFMGDFTSGGWNSFLNPANNPIGAFFDSVDKVDKDINTAQQNTKDELARNNGFLDMKTCAQEAPKTTSSEEAIRLGLSQPVTCLRYETVTPGSIVGQQVAYTTNSPIRQAELATHFNEAVGAFFDSLLNQLFSRGLSGIKGQAGKNDIGLSTGGDGTNIVTGLNGQILAGVNDNVSDINNIAASGSTIDISRPQLIRDVLKKQYDYLNRTKDSRMVVDRLLPELGQLDYCLPGPNPTWKDGLENNFSGFLKIVFPIKMIAFEGISYKDNADTLLFTDKITGNTVRAFPVGVDEHMPLYIKLDTSPGFNVSKFLLDSYNGLVADFSAKFSRQAIGDAFASTKANTLDQDYARGAAIDIYDEVSNLPTVASNIVDADTSYDAKIQTTEQDIRDLEAIRRQASDIVAKAKARYVAEKKAAGTPVNMQCLDAAYSINNTAVTGVPRAESDIKNPILQKMLEYNQFFYSQES
jgi:hypothetical protein